MFGMESEIYWKATANGNITHSMMTNIKNPEKYETLQSKDLKVHDNIHVYEALATVKKLGLSVKKDQHVVINLCTEIASIKQEISRLENLVESRDLQIKKLKVNLKKQSADQGSQSLENETDFVNTSTQTDVKTANIRTQTMTKEINSTSAQTDQFEAKASGNEKELIEVKDQSVQFENFEEGITRKDADTQCYIETQESFAQTSCNEFVENGTQMDCVDQHDAATQFSSSISKTDDFQSKTLDAIKDACTMIENSLEMRKVIKIINISTQTERDETTDTPDSSTDSTNISMKLPPINRENSMAKSRSAFHKKCIPPKKKGKSWVF